MTETRIKTTTAKNATKTAAKTATKTRIESRRLAPELLADLAGTLASLMLPGPAISALSLGPYASFIEGYGLRLRPAATRIVCGILKENPGLIAQGWQSRAAAMMALVQRYEAGDSDPAATRAFSLNQAQTLMSGKGKGAKAKTSEAPKQTPNRAQAGPIAYTSA